MESVIEKFMDSMGVTYKIDVGPIKIVRGSEMVCVEISARHKGNQELLEYYCYIKKNGNKVVFDEGNEIMGPNDGIFKYLGMKNEVNKYFSDKARHAAVETFSENEF